MGEGWKKEAYREGKKEKITRIFEETPRWGFGRGYCSYSRYRVFLGYEGQIKEDC